mgnify:FL=1
MSKMPKKQPWGEKVQDSRIADKRIKHCKECNRCWEILYYGNKENFYYYYDFPTYGKQKQICKHCKGENNEQNVMDKSLM